MAPIVFDVTDGFHGKAMTRVSYQPWMHFALPDQ